MTKQAGFVLYRRYKKMFDKLTVEQRGELITAIFDYFCEGERKTLSDAATEMAFLFISEQLDYDCSEYEKKCKQNAENAAKRWARREAGTMRSHTDASHRTESQCDADAKPCEAMPTNTNTESESKTNPISISESESGSESKSNTECESVEPPPHPDALTRGETDSPPPPDIKEEKNEYLLPLRGRYRNVRLTALDMAMLKAEFPDDYDKRIERLSEYIATRGDKYINHAAVIRAWAKTDWERTYNAGASGGVVNRGVDKPPHADSAFSTFSTVSTVSTGEDGGFEENEYMDAAMERARRYLESARSESDDE